MTRNAMLIALGAVIVGGAAIIALASSMRSGIGGIVLPIGTGTTVETAVRSEGLRHLMLRLLVQRDGFAAGLLLSDDEDPTDEDQIVFARRSSVGGWSAGGGGRGAGPREARRAMPIGVGVTSGWSRSDGTGEAYVAVGGRAASHVHRVEVRLADGSLEQAHVQNGGYLWLRAESGLPPPLRADVHARAVLPDRLRPIEVTAFDVSGKEIQRKTLQTLGTSE